MWHPFKSLIDRIMQDLEERFAENDHMPRAQKQQQADPLADPKLTPFEKDLIRVLEYHRQKQDARAVYVSIEAHVAGTHRYEDPLTGFGYSADAAIGFLEKGESYAAFIEAEHSIDHNVVMLLDPQGPALSEQIPNWKAGQISFPDQYLSFPVIAVKDAHELTAHSLGCMGIAQSDSMQMKRYAQQQAPSLPADNTKICSIAATHIKDYGHAAESVGAYRDLPEFKTAFVENAAGRSVAAPRHIRGIYTNDSVQGPEHRL